MSINSTRIALKCVKLQYMYLEIHVQKKEIGVLRGPDIHPGFPGHVSTSDRT